MRVNLEFLLGLLEQDDPICVCREDFDGKHGVVLQLCRELGLLHDEPGANPAASCPHCEEGIPYRLGHRWVCNSCRSTVDAQRLFLWEIDREVFLRWLAEQLQLRGGVRQVDEQLWQLGTWASDNALHECFYCRGATLTERERTRLAAYRQVLIFYGLIPPKMEMAPGFHLSLLELLQTEGSLTVADLRPLLRPRGNVRFEEHSGALWVGNSWLGEVPFGSKKYFFLQHLAQQLDRFVPYPDLKYAVLLQTSSRDTTEEATFCHNLKRRMKKNYIEQIDLLLKTTNKADGYRLCGYAEL